MTHSLVEHHSIERQMTSSVEAALDLLQSTAVSERLSAARFLALHARTEDLPALRRAIAKENVLWVKKALGTAIVRAIPQSDPTSPETESDIVPVQVVEELNARAMETTTSLLIHEIEPLLGSLRLSASDEVPNFHDSRTFKAIDRIDEFLSALARLRRAAGSPRIEEFALDDLIKEVIEGNPNPGRVKFQLSGPDYCIVEGDRSLISMCVSNGIRNAVEATIALDDAEEQPVVVAWGATDTENWVSIVDVGIGFRGNTQRALEIGTTTKAGHLGMGLAIANQSISSMSGALVLAPNSRGVRFEIRWPRHPGSS